jgi:hypothetical protein
MVHPLGQVAGGAAGGHRLLLPTLRQEQPPVQRAAGPLGGRVDRHPSWQLARLPSVPEYWRCTPPSSCRLWRSRCRRPPTRSVPALRSAPRPAAGGPAASPRGRRRQSGAAPGSGPRRGVRPSARSTCAARPAVARAGSTRRGRADRRVAATRRPPQPRLPGVHRSWPVRLVWGHPQPAPTCRTGRTGPSHPIHPPPT